MQILVGVGRVDITPPIGVRLAGYPRRHEPSQAIQSPLFASTLVVGDTNPKAVLVTCDLAYLRAPQVDIIRTQIADIASVSPQAVMISCSHSHSSPNTGAAWIGGHLATPSVQEERYQDNLSRLIVASVQTSLSNLRPARISFGRGSCDLAVNRREVLPDGRVIIGHNPTGPIDRDVLVARVDARDDETPLATLVHFTCHPTVLGPDSLYIGPDYVGPMRNLVEANTGAPCLFFQGAAGNVAPRRAFASTLDEPGRFGKVLGAEVLKVWYQLTTRPVQEQSVLIQSVSTMRRIVDEPVPDVMCALRSVEGRVDLAFSEAVSAQALRQVVAELQNELSTLEQRRAPGSETNPVLQKLLWAQNTLRQRTAGQLPESCAVSLTALVLGSQAVFLAVPAEPFVEMQLQVKRAAGFPYVFFCGYSNGCVGYIPSPEAHATGGYEVTDAHKLYGMPASFHPDSQERIVRALLAMLGANA